jgi:tRNA dimethylallyltransferase
MAERPVIVVAGPTASGKSGLAMGLAEQLDGTIINADSMQVYRDLRILTARPSQADEDRIPHLLYGDRDATQAGSAADWAAAAHGALQSVFDAGRRPILVGGTGLYLKALLEGLAPIPEVHAGARSAMLHSTTSSPRETPRSPPGSTRVTVNAYCGPGRSWRRPAGRYRNGKTNLCRRRTRCFA